MWTCVTAGQREAASKHRRFLIYLNLCLFMSQSRRFLDPSLSLECVAYVRLFWPAEGGERQTPQGLNETTRLLRRAAVGAVYFPVLYLQSSYSLTTTVNAPYLPLLRRSSLPRIIPSSPHPSISFSFLPVVKWLSSSFMGHRGGLHGRSCCWDLFPHEATLWSVCAWGVCVGVFLRQILFMRFLWLWTIADLDWFDSWVNNSVLDTRFL